PECRRHCGAVARAGSGCPDDGPRRQGPSGLSDRSHRVRVRPRRGALRRGRRVPGARRAPGRASRTHGVPQRRPAARSRRRGARPRRGRRPGMAVSTTVAVAGAGLAGLSAAWELSRAGADVVVLDAVRRPGGVVVTERRDGFVVEGGPDGFLAAEPDIQELARDAGIGARLVDQITSGSSLWTGRRMEPLAEGQAAALLGIQGVTQSAMDCGFRTFATGMADLVEALVARVGPAIRPAQGVTGLAPATRGWRLSLGGGSTLAAEAVILALPAWVAARLVAAAGVPAARRLDDVIYYPTTTVSLAYRGDQLATPLAGTGFVSAGEWAGVVGACSYSWLKYPGRAPPGQALLRGVVGPLDDGPAPPPHAQLASLPGI